ncbi:MAG: 16S rRNA (guanine(527)-N(7))-methyltransferase RsmG [Cyclobacteriaceae bacterium]
MEAAIIYKYFPDLTTEQKKQFDALGHLYAEWNDKINVISRKDIEELYERHVLHSLAIARFGQFPDGSHILDIGTGGGFPGIPLAIFFPNCQFYLVDSIAKKIKVVNEVAQAIGLTNLKAEHQRAEKVKSKFDYIVSRAVARTKQLTNWTNHLIKTNMEDFSSGYILLKGGDLKEELKEVKRKYQEENISSYFDEPFFETKKIIYIPY